MPAASWATIRAALKTRIATIAGLQEYEYNPPTPTPPCAIVMPFEAHNPYHTTDGSHGSWLIPVRIIVSKASDRNGQKRLDEYLARSGTKSVFAALLADNTLAGAVAGVIPQGHRAYQEWIYGDIPYYGAEIPVRVWG